MLGFDLETTGLDVNCDRIVQYALVLRRPGREPVRACSIVNPRYPIPEAAAVVHGITTKRAEAEGQPARQALAILLAGIGQAVARGWPVVAMNGCYDLTLLDRELRRPASPPWPSTSPAASCG
jgi:DNA polymerase III subunit epsilon